MSERAGIGEQDARGRGDRAQAVPVWLVGLVVVLAIAVIAAGATVVVKLTAPDARAVDGSIDDWRAKVAGDPSNVDAHLGLAYAYQQMNRFEEAAAAYDEVLARDAQNLGALYNKAVVLSELDRQSEAEELFRDVLEIAPEHALAATALGDYYREAGRYAELVDVVAPAAGANPEMADLQALLGEGYENTGRAAEAEQAYRTALRSAPDLAAAREGLARLGVDE